MVTILKLFLLITCTFSTQQFEDFLKDQIDIEKQAISQDIHLLPNDPYELENPLPFKVAGSCICKITSGSVVIVGDVENGNVKVNGVEYHSGQQPRLTVKNGDKFTIEASPQAKGQLINRGSQELVATCSL